MLEFLSGLSSSEHHQMAPYSTSGLCYNSKILCIITMEMNRCAAKERCICKVAGAHDGRHACCPACRCNIHTICGELCKDAGLVYHTTCFPGVAQHKWTFESPEDFQLHLTSVIAAAHRQEDSVAVIGRNEFSAPRTTVIVSQVMGVDVKDIFDSGHKMGDAVPTGQKRSTSVETTTRS